ncbi:hypothetical protein DSM21852_01810 [Methylocystis bryophila]|nr:hypothetical protein DSM21852_01810 [Methylocystis bryophila]
MTGPARVALDPRDRAATAKLYRRREVMTPLLEASAKGRVAELRALIDGGADLGVTTVDGNNALWLASAAGSLEAIQMLIDAGIEVDHRNPDGATALIYAASAGKAEIVAVLLRHGADPTLETRDGFSALDLASTVECLALLRKAHREVRASRSADAAP